MRIEPELGGVSIVLVGSFNPSIFSPFWLAKQELVTVQEADAASVIVIHPEFVQFEIGLFIISVEPHKFSVECTRAPWISLADFVSRTFGETLVHTPLRQFGINRNVHFGVGTEQARNRIGRLLAPIELWGDWGKEIDTSDPNLRGGMVSLTMQQKWSDTDFKGAINTTVQPSSRITGNSGIYVQVNDHVESVNPSAVDGAFSIVSFLASRFEGSIDKSEIIIDQVMALKDQVTK